MVDREHARLVLENQERLQERARQMQRGSSREISTGLWVDPLSEARHDYDGAQSAFEASIAQTKSIVDAIGGSFASGDLHVLDAVWDSALEIAAHVLHTRMGECSDREWSIEMQKLIRAMKKQR